MSYLVYWDKPPPPVPRLSTAPGGGHYSYRTYTYHTRYGVDAVIVWDGFSYKPWSYSSPGVINSRIHCSCFTRE